MSAKKVICFVSFLLSDILSILICLYLAFLTRKYLLPNLYHGFSRTFPLGDYPKYFYFTVLWVFAFAYEKLYTKRRPFWNETKHLLRGTTFATALAIMLIFIAKRSGEFSRPIILLVWFFSLVIMPASRFLVKSALRKVGLWKKHVLILGANGIGKRVLEGIRKNPILGYEVVGFLDDDKGEIGEEISGVEVLGRMEDVEKFTKAKEAKDVIIAMPSLPGDRLKELLAKCENGVESVSIVPDVFESITLETEAAAVGDVFLLQTRQNLTKPWNIAIKRAFDLSLCLFGSLLFLPILALIAIAIKLNSRGPVFYVDERLGKGNKNFRCLKFRSMYPDADERLWDYLEGNPESREEWEKYQKLKSEDPRVTKVGKFLRRYSLDELSQIFNVLKGEMSLVGPRPYLPRELGKIGAFRKTILRVYPGITGFWQVSGRNELPFEERLRMDEYYVRNWSLWLDFSILAKTLGVVLRSKGAY